MRKLLSLSLLCLVLAVGFPLQALAGGDGGDLQPSFRDVNRSHWFYEPVTIMAERGLISGDGDGAFRPNDTITVAEFVKVLVSAMGHVMVPAKAGFWAEPFLQKAAELGVMQPEAFDDVRRPITRGEMAGMIVRAAEAEAGDDSRLALDLPDALSAYALWITDYGQLSKAEQDDALRVFASGIMSGFPDGRIGFDQPATRAEACAMLLRLMEQERRIPPAWPMTAELRDTWSVKSFTTELLAAIGEEASMERAVEWGIVRPETDYPSHDKPILRREAALTIARLLDRLTGYTALFTTGDNRYFLEGRFRRSLHGERPLHAAGDHCGQLRQSRPLLSLGAAVQHDVSGRKAGGRVFRPVGTGAGRGGRKFLRFFPDRIRDVFAKSGLTRSDRQKNKTGGPFVRTAGSSSAGSKMMPCSGIRVRLSGKTPA